METFWLERHRTHPQGQRRLEKKYLLCPLEGGSGLQLRAALKRPTNMELSLFGQCGDGRDDLTGC